MHLNSYFPSKDTRYLVPVRVVVYSRGRLHGYFAAPAVYYINTAVLIHCFTTAREETRVSNTEGDCSISDKERFGLPE